MNWGKIISTKHLSPYKVDEICKLFIKGEYMDKYSVKEIAEMYEVGYSVINRIKNIWISYQTKSGKTTHRRPVYFAGWTNEYYPKEENIMEELELNYDNAVLTGDELEIFNKL